MTMLPVPWKQAVREGALAGTLASLLSTLALAAATRSEAGSPAAGINAVSHWLWGDESVREDGWTWKHTLPGALTQHAASVFWAILYSAAYGHRAEAKRVPDAIAGAIATSATAYVVDYTITPKRLTPGYEYRLDGKGMLAVYAALAAGLALGAIAMGRNPPRS